MFFQSRSALFYWIGLLALACAGMYIFLHCNVLVCVNDCSRCTTSTAAVILVEIFQTWYMFNSEMVSSHNSMTHLTL